MFNDTNLDPGFVKSNINVLVDWVQKDQENRKVRIDIESGKIKVWIYDFAMRASAYIKRTDKVLNTEDIDNILKIEKEEEERKRYEELKAKFEQKEGELRCKEQQLA